MQLKYLLAGGALLLGSMLISVWAPLWLLPLACVLGCAAGLVGVRSLGCGASGAASATPARGSRPKRAIAGTFIVALAATLVAGGYWLECAELWPLAALATWFGAAQWVSLARGTSGCPELELLQLLFRRQSRASPACPPLESHCEASAGTCDRRS